MLGVPVDVPILDEGTLENAVVVSETLPVVAGIVGACIISPEGMPFIAGTGIPIPDRVAASSEVDVFEELPFKFCEDGSRADNRLSKLLEPDRLDRGFKVGEADNADELLPNVLAASAFCELI